MALVVWTDLEASPGLWVLMPLERAEADRALQEVLRELGLEGIGGVKG